MMGNQYKCTVLTDIKVKICSKVGIPKDKFNRELLIEVMHHIKRKTCKVNIDVLSK